MAKASRAGMYCPLQEQAQIVELVLGNTDNPDC